MGITAQIIRNWKIEILNMGMVPLEGVLGSSYLLLLASMKILNQAVGQRDEDEEDMVLSPITDDGKPKRLKQLI